MQRTKISILDNIEFIASLKYPILLKSTISPNYFNFFYESYLNIKSLIKDLSLNCKYSPTIDFYSDLNFEIINFHDFKINYRKILESEELEDKSYFFWENKKIECNAGKDLFSVDQDGSIFFCHGCFYFGNVKKIGTIFDDDIHMKIKEHKNYQYIINKNIKTKLNCECCSNKFCIFCPIVMSNGKNCKLFNLINKGMEI